MKIRIYETDFDGRPVDCSGEYFSGKTALDIVEGMTMNPFQSHLTPHKFMEQTWATIGVQQAFDDLTNVWDVMFPVERYKFINEVVEKITVHIDRVEIEYKTDGLETVITEAEASNEKNN